MTVRDIGNNLIAGLSSDTKPTTYGNDTIFIEIDTGAMYVWETNTWFQRSSGLTVSNTYTKTSESTTAELLQQWKISDDANSFIKLDNLITTDAKFVPHLLARQDAVSTSEALRFDVEVGDLLDSGTVPAFRINLRRVDQTEITTRPLYEIANDDTAVFIVTPSEFDFTGKSVTDASINATDNVITDTSIAVGDLLKSNGSKFVKFARGTAYQLIRTNSGATDLEYVNREDIISDSYLEFDPMTAPSAPSGNSRRIYVDSSTNHLLLKKPDASTIDIEAIASGGGETNTISNIGTGGVGVWKQKVGVNHELKSINAGASGTITITDDTTDNEIDIDVNTSNLLLSNIGGTIVDSQIATHTTTKITTTNKSLLNSAIIYNDQNNNLGDFYLDIGDIATPANPSAGIRRLFVDSGTGALSVRTSAGTTLSLEAGATGEANTISNIGTAGVGIWKQKVGINHELKKLNAGSNKVTITDDTGNNEVDIDVVEANLTLSSIGGSVTSGQLPAATVLTDQANTFGDFLQTFRHAKFAIFNSSNTFKHIFEGTATADRTITIPNTTGAILLDVAVQTLTNKTIDGGTNTLQNISDTSIAAHATTKITTSNKSLLNSNIMYEDEDNNAGPHYLQFTEIADPTTPSADTARLYLDNSSGEISVIKDSGQVKSLEISNVPVLDDIGDVVITSVQDTEVLTWDSATSKWINATTPGAGAETVKTNQANTYDAFAQTFKNSTIKIRNPADTFGVTIDVAAIAANKTVTFPGTADTSDVFLLAGASTQNITGSKRFNSNTLRVWNPATTFSYFFSSSAITGSDKQMTLPLLTANDVFVFEAHSQTLTNKTLTSPTIGTILNTGILTLPTSTDTLVGRDTTDTLTNKTISGSSNTISNVPLTALPTAAKQYPFMWGEFLNQIGANWSDSRVSPLGGVRWVSSNNLTKITLSYKAVITRVRLGVENNTKNASTSFSIMDDNVAVPNTTITVNAVTNGYFDSGAISEVIASGSDVEIKVNMGSSTSGQMDCLVQIWGYYDPNP